MKTLTIDSPIGPLRAEFDERAVRRIVFHARGEGTHDPHGLQERFTAYFHRKPGAFDGLAFEDAGTAFQRDAWAAMRAIPFGETLTYGELGERIGRNKATCGRAVGAACGANPLPIITPCHRVMGSGGKVTGFGGGVQTKRWLLDFESAQRPVGSHA